MDIELVGMDLDGTVVDALPYWQQANTDAFAEHKIEFTDQHYRWYVGSNRSFTDLLAHMEIDDPVLGARIDEQRNQIYDLLLTENIAFIDGVPDLLESLRSADFKLGIATSARRQNVNAMAMRLPLHNFFQRIITREDMGKRQKPDGYGVELLQQHFTVAPEHSAYIGDQLTDDIAARNAGALGIVVRHSHTPADVHQHAEHVFENVDALRRAIFESEAPIFRKK